MQKRRISLPSALTLLLLSVGFACSADLDSDTGPAAPVDATGGASTTVPPEPPAGNTGGALGTGGLIEGTGGSPTPDGCSGLICSETCVDTETDADHCGGCDQPCSEAEQCEGGTCQCAPGLEDCFGSCVDTTAHGEHCGSCGNPCDAEEACFEGACVTDCPPHLSECSDPACPAQLVGWASVSGDGVSTTTGGGNATPVRPTTVQQLLDYASDGQARVIEIQGSFNVPLLDVKSNKTLIGIGNDATLNGGIRIQGNSGSRVQNVIIRNLRINARTSSDSNDNDGIQMRYAHHVWVDHCEIWDAADGNLDIVRMSDFITVSWTKFWYSSNPPDNNHRFCNLIGNGDGNEAEDGGRLKVTMHHNWWAERVHERMPRVRFGQVHVFNNYFTSSGNNYCVRAGRGARLLVQNNYFHGVNRPHEFNNATDQDTAHITAQGNTYDGTSGTQATGGGGTPFTNPPYDYSLETPAAARDAVQSCAGPR